MSTPVDDTFINSQSGQPVVFGGDQNSYLSDFPLTENPINESGKWVNGLADGINWQNVKTESGYACASVICDQGASRYDDNLAHIAATYINFNADQYAQGVVHRAAGYSPGGQHEIELLLRFSISANSATGYEVLWGHAGNGAIVRWNGALGSYTPLLDGRAWGAAVPGDVLRAELSGNIITVYKNGSPIDNVDITSLGGQVWTSGQPGVGFWPVDGGVVIENYGWASFEAGNI